MKPSSCFFATLSAIVLSLGTSALGQGTFPPAAGPSIPVMKTLTQVEPRTPLPGGGPFTISSPGSYYLTGNVTVPAGVVGIQVSATNVTLDLNGFTISGPGEFGSLYAGIQVSGQNNFTVRNGSIIRMGRGIRITGTTNNFGHRLENLMINQCAQAGIYFENNAPGSIITGCSISQMGTASNGGSVYGIYTFGGNRITNCNIDTIKAVTGSAGYGMDLVSTDTVVDCTIANCTTGIRSGKYKDNLFIACTNNTSGGTDAGGNN